MKADTAGILALKMWTAGAILACIELIVSTGKGAPMSHKDFQNAHKVTPPSCCLAVRKRIGRRRWNLTGKGWDYWKTTAAQRWLQYVYVPLCCNIQKLRILSTQCLLWLSQQTEFSH